MPQPTPSPDRRQKRGEGAKPWYSARRNAFRIRPPRAPGAKWQSDEWVACGPAGAADSSAEAEAWRILRRRMHERETTGTRKRGPDRRTTVAGWVTRYVADPDEGGLATNLRPSSRRTHQYVATHIVRELTRIRLVDLQASDVAAMLNRLEARGLTANRRYQVLSLLRVALDAAMRDERIGRNVAELVRSPRRVEASLRPPTPAEVDRILAVVLDHPVYGAAYAVCVATGMRQGEALALRWRDLISDPVTGRPSVLVETTLEYGTDNLGDGPKTRAAKRLVPLAPFAVQALEARRRWQLDNGSAGRDGLIFTTAAGTAGRSRPVGSPIRGATIYEHLQRVQRELGIGPYRWHDFRHEAATRLVRKGVDVKRIAILLGHASVATTSRYLHSDADASSALDPYHEAKA